MFSRKHAFQRKKFDLEKDFAAPSLGEGIACASRPPQSCSMYDTDTENFKHVKYECRQQELKLTGERNDIFVQAFERSEEGLIGTDRLENIFESTCKGNLDGT
jgi:hypothetical protein